MSRRIALMLTSALAGAGCARGAGNLSIPSVQIAIPQESQATLGYSELFLSSDGKLYVTPTAGVLSAATTFGFHIKPVSNSTTGGASRSEEPPGTITSALTGDNPVISRAVAAVIMLSAIDDPLAPSMDAIDFIFAASSTTGSASITTNRASPGTPQTL